MLSFSKHTSCSIVLFILVFLYGMKFACFHFKKYRLFVKYIKFFLFFFAIFSNFSHGSTLSIKKNAEIIKTRHRLDKRKVKNSSYSSSLDAVGKLTHYGRKRGSKTKIDCSASLIAPDFEMGSDIVITANHCLSEDVISYKWLSKTQQGKIERVGKVIYQDKENDWALINLNNPIDHNEIKPLIINYENINELTTEKITVAGFSMDWLGDYGKKLTYEDNPKYIKLSKTNSNIGKVGALTHQGDSGGAIIYQEEEQGYLVGVMSFISPDKNLFKSTKGTFGNLSGYFLDFFGNRGFHNIVQSYF